MMAVPRVASLHPLAAENVAAVSHEELRVELAARLAEHAEFAATVHAASSRIARLIEADLAIEAHQTAGGLYVRAARQLRRLG